MSSIATGARPEAPEDPLVGPLSEYESARRRLAGIEGRIAGASAAAAAARRTQDEVCGRYQAALATERSGRPAGAATLWSESEAAGRRAVEADAACADLETERTRAIAEVASAGRGLARAMRHAGVRELRRGEELLVDASIVPSAPTPPRPMTEAELADHVRRNGFVPPPQAPPPAPEPTWTLEVRTAIDVPPGIPPAEPGATPAPDPLLRELRRWAPQLAPGAIDELVKVWLPMASWPTERIAREVAARLGDRGHARYLSPSYVPPPGARNALRAALLRRVDELAEGPATVEALVAAWGMAVVGFSGPEIAAWVDSRLSGQENAHHVKAPGEQAVFAALSHFAGRLRPDVNLHSLARQWGGLGQGPPYRVLAAVAQRLATQPHGDRLSASGEPLAIDFDDPQFQPPPAGTPAGRSSP